MKKLDIICCVMLMLLLGSCTNTEQFRVNGTIEGKPTMNMRIGFWADGAYRTIVTAAREGEFEFFASSRGPTIVEITDYDYRPLARLYAQNGETFELAIDRSKPFDVKVSGNEVSQRWARFYADNAEAMTAGPARINEVVGQYISSHPDDIVSTLLLLTSYDATLDALEADSLLSSIVPQARPSALTESFTYSLQRLVAESAADSVPSFRYLHADSAEVFDPAKNKASLIAFTLENNDDYPKLAEVLETIARQLPKEARVYDLRVDPPRGYMASDTIRRVSGYLVGGLTTPGVDRLGIARLPVFIVCDSAGVQLYRGNDLSAAQDAANAQF